MLKIEMLDIDSLIPYERNNKKHPPEQVEKIARQIKEHGFDVPIVVDKSLVIIKGHGRVLACKQLGLKQVPCIVRTDLTPEQVRLERIADNKVAESEYDMAAINLEFQELSLLNIDLTLSGFDSFEDLNEKDYIPKDGAKELNPEDFQDFEHKCPKCGFQWNNK